MPRPLSPDTRRFDTLWEAIDAWGPGQLRDYDDGVTKTFAAKFLIEGFTGPAVSATLAPRSNYVAIYFPGVSALGMYVCHGFIEIAPALREAHPGVAAAVEATFPAAYWLHDNEGLTIPFRRHRRRRTA